MADKLYYYASKPLNAVLATAACFFREKDGVSVGQELAPINSSVAKPAFYVNKEGETISSFGFRL